ncbi:MAG: hypothetical protein D6798_02310 [Deltaproteobacteria bacterium]|nr:MAG: hypothetical protein D6798_02310 [Deltaproteobacteria bacterium]
MSDCKHRRRNRRGNYGTLFGLTLPVLLGGAAIAVDLSYQKVVYAQLQAVADAASSTGAAYLDGTPDGVAAAREAAIRAALRNKADGKPVVLDPGDIVTGYWDVDAWRFVPSTDPAEIDAIQVTLSRNDIRSNFATVNAVGRRTIGALARSIATQPQAVPAGSVSCYIPLAIPDCLFDEYEDDELTSFTFQFSPAGIDNVGWARVDGHPNTSWLVDQIEDCHQDGIISVGDDVYLDNGVKVPALRAVADEIEDADSDSDDWDSDDWGEQPEQSDHSDVDSDEYGKVFQGAIIVFDGGDEYCDCEEPKPTDEDGDGDSDSDSDEDTDSDTDSDSDSDDDSDTEGDSDRDTEGDSDDRGTHDPDNPHARRSRSSHGHGHDDDSEADSEDHDDDSDSDSDSDSDDESDTDGDSDTDSDTDSDADDAPECEFGGGHFNGVETIVGFAWAEIYDVRVTGAASQKNLWLRIDPYADQNVGTSGGGEVDAGVTFGPRSAVVQ